jgi:predicted ATPase
VSRSKRKGKPRPFLKHLELLRDRVPNPNKYPYNLPAIRTLTTLEFHAKVTYLIGENGSGKSTLLEAIALGCGLNPEGGSRNFNFATRASHSPLDGCLRLSRLPGLPGDSYFLRAESYYNVASEIERLDNDPDANKLSAPKIIDGFGRVPLHEQSHGESFFALFKNRFRDNGLYLLDEPEAALSPKRQLEFLVTMHDYLRRGGQFVIATHSPIIMAYPDSVIYQLSGDGIREVAYADTEHYLITRGFLTNPKRSLDILMADDSPDRMQ